VRQAGADRNAAQCSMPGKQCANCLRGTGQKKGHLAVALSKSSQKTVLMKFLLVLNAFTKFCFFKFQVL
jgi:hypothetical protein